MTRSTIRPVATSLAAIALLGAAVAFAATTEPTSTPPAAAPAAAAPAAAKGPTKGDAAAGKKIFDVKCVACHKADGTGGIKLTGNPTPNWKDPKVWNDPKRATDDYFRDCITNGKMTSGMVAWVKTGQVKPAEMENLIAYIHKLGGPMKAGAAPAAATKK
jgi:cytochrome c oxidase cbb3-type subunit 3